LETAARMRLLCNEIRTLARVAKLLHECAVRMGKMLHKRYAEQHGGPPHLASLDAVLEHAPAHKKVFYAKVCSQLKGETPRRDGLIREGFDPILDTRGSCFVKQEAYLNHSKEVKLFYANSEGQEVKEKDPRPRLICDQNPCKVLMMSRILLPIEDWVYAQSILEGSPRCMAKGLNSEQTGSLLLEKWSMFSTPVALCGDCSSFDGHVTVDQLKAVHTFYKQMFPQLYAIPELLACLNSQLFNRCKSRVGFSFACKGRRMSGDRDTAFGNTLLTVMFVHTALWKVKFELICDGDDFVVICEDSIRQQVKSKLMDFYTGLGHELGFDVITTQFEHVDFCQKKPIILSPGRCKLIRNPMKVFSTVTASTRNYESVGSRKALFRSIGIGDYYVNSNVPVFGELARMLYRVSTGGELSGVTSDAIKTLIGELQHNDPLRIRLIAEKNLPVDDYVSASARYSFEQAYNISPVQQLAMEYFFKSTKHYDFTADIPVCTHPSAPAYGDV